MKSVKSLYSTQAKILTAAKALIFIDDQDYGPAISAHYGLPVLSTAKFVPDFKPPDKESGPPPVKRQKV